MVQTSNRAEKSPKPSESLSDIFPLCFQVYQVFIAIPEGIRILSGLKQLPLICSLFCALAVWEGLCWGILTLLQGGG